MNTSNTEQPALESPKFQIAAWYLLGKLIAAGDIPLPDLSKTRGCEQIQNLIEDLATALHEADKLDLLSC